MRPLDGLLRSEEMSIIITIILLAFMFDFTKLRQQNEKMIEQNDRMISLLEEQVRRDGE